MATTQNALVADHGVMLTEEQSSVRLASGKLIPALSAEEAIKRAETHSERKAYRCVLAADAPCHSFSLGPITFHKFTTKRVNGQEVHSQGQVVMLTNEEIGVAAAAARFKFFRVKSPAKPSANPDLPGDSGTADEFDTRTPGCFPVHGDKPVIEFLRIEPAPKLEDYTIPTDLEDVLKTLKNAAPLLERTKEDKASVAAAAKLGIKVDTMPQKG